MGLYYRIFVFTHRHVLAVKGRRALFWIGFELFGTAYSAAEASASEGRVGKFHIRISLALAFDPRVLRNTTRLGHHDRGLVLAPAPLYECEPRALRISELVRQHARFNIPHRTDMDQSGEDLGGQSGVSCTPAASGRGRTVWLLAAARPTRTRASRPMLLLRCGLRCFVRAAGFRLDRAGGYYSLHVYRAFLVRFAGLDSGRKRVQQYNPAGASHLSRIAQLDYVRPPQPGHSYYCDCRAQPSRHEP